LNHIFGDKSDELIMTAAFKSLQVDVVALLGMMWLDSSR